MIKGYNLRDITRACKAYRMSLGFRQSDVAFDLNYSTENISAFEQGRNDSLAIFRWYLDNGFTIDYLNRYLESMRY